MTLAEARSATINAINNSTKCCWQSYPNSGCYVHTAEWVENEAARRVNDANTQATFHREWTHKLGDIMPKTPARTVGERLWEFGLRVHDGKSYRASHGALRDDIARIVERNGYPTVYWNRERLIGILVDGPTAQETAQWETMNRNHERYEAELAELDKIIDHDAYLTKAEQYAIINVGKSGMGSTAPINRRATQRAHKDKKNGVPLLPFGVKIERWRPYEERF